VEYLVPSRSRRRSGSPMRLHPQQAHAISSGVWLIGFGVLFATGYWWPGILILCGITAIVEGWARGQGWYALQGGIWLIMFAVWAMLHFNIAVLFVALGLSMISSAFVRPSFLKKPQVDHSLD
jgi:hydrogenase/urease accessory protein HupE